MDSKPGLKKSSWWKRRTTLEKILFVSILFVSAAAAAVIILIGAMLSTGIFSGVELMESSYGGHLAIESNNVLRPAAALTENPVNDSLRPVHFFRYSAVPLSNDTEFLAGNGLPHGRQTHVQQQQQHLKEERESIGARKMRRKRSRSEEEQERKRQNFRGTHPMACLRCRNKQKQKRRSSTFRFGMAVHTITKITNRKETADAAQSANEVCLTPDCVTAAARMIQSIDHSVDPCDDFFDYSCGTWNRMHPIPEDRPSYSTFRKLDDQLHAILKELLAAPLKSTDIDAVKHAKTLYRSCLETTIIEQKQDAPLKELIKGYGGWPVLEPNWSEEGFDLAVTLAKLKVHNNIVLINHWVNSDDKNSDVNIIQIDQGLLGMPNKEYFERGRADKILMIYEQFIVSVACAMGADKDKAIHQITEMIDFEVELANITIPEEKRRDMEAMYHRFRLKDLYGNLTDQIDWVKYFVTIFTPLNISIDEEEEVVVYTVDYLRDLGKLIRKTPIRTLMNYAIWHVVLSRMNSLSQKFFDLRRDFHKALHGTGQERARWHVCVNSVNDNLGMVVGRMYVLDNFEERAKASATVMIKRMKESFKENLQEVTWLDEKTKKVAKEKADAIQEKIGYPDYILNDTALNFDYEGIALDEEDYFANILNILEVAVANNHKKLRDSVDRDRWNTAPAVVNAFYSSPTNLITFPAGIFHPPFYHKNYPMSLNFGGIGMVIGHEITHGFDDKGRQFDKDGNLKLWWSPADVEHFKEKTQCIVDQYSNYTIPEVGLNINGRLTQGENIADNGGLKQAYRAYKKWTKSHPPEPVLPGLNFTHDQLFFLNFAQVWCGTFRPENIVQAIRVSKHCPGKIRVIGTVSNSVDFAKAFSCPLGSNMNPIKKCNVW